METAEASITEKPETTTGLLSKIRRGTYRKYKAEEKIRIVLEGFRGEISVSELCRRESIHVNVYYKWMKDFMEAGKSRLRGDSLREANRSEVEEMKRENERLKILAGEQSLEINMLKKSVME